MLGTRATDNIAIVAFNNLVGGQDELVFDGNSMILDEKGRIIAEGKQFEEDLVMADLDVESVFRTRLHDPRWRKETLLWEETKPYTPKIVISEEPSTSRKQPLTPSQPKIYTQTGEVYDALVLGTSTISSATSTSPVTSM